MSFEILQSTHAPMLARQILYTAQNLIERDTIDSYAIEEVVDEAVDNLGSAPVWSEFEFDGAYHMANDYLEHNFNSAANLSLLNVEELSDAIALGLEEGHNFELDLDRDIEQRALQLFTDRMAMAHV